MRAFVKALLRSGIHVVFWLAAFFLIRGLTAQGSEASAAYGLLSGWWAALYGGYLFRLELRIFPILFLGYVVFETACSSLGQSCVFPNDAGSPPSIIIGGLIFSSPVLVNSVVHFLISRSSIWSVLAGDKSS